MVEGIKKFLYLHRDIKDALLASVSAGALFYLSFTVSTIASLSVILQFIIPASVVILTLYIGQEYLQATYLNLKSYLINFIRQIKAKQKPSVPRLDMSFLISLSLITSLIYGIILGPIAPLALYIAPVITLGAVKLSSYLKNFITTWNNEQYSKQIAYLERLCNITAHLDYKTNQEFTLNPNEVIPVDCILLDPQPVLILDQSITTGDYNRQLTINNNQILFQGTRYIGTNPVRVKAVCDSKDSKLYSSIQKLQSNTENTNISRYLDSIVTIFVPVILLIALSTLLFWGFTAGFTLGFGFMMDVIFAACPCALIFARDIPLAIMKKISFYNNIIFSNSDIIEKLARTSPQNTTFVLDLTNTLTELTYKDIHSCDEDFPRRKSVILADVLKLEQKRLESSSDRLSDPYAKELIRSLSSLELPVSSASTEIVTPNINRHNGMTGSVADRQYVIGNYEFIKEHFIDHGYAMTQEMKQQLRNKGFIFPDDNSADQAFAQERAHQSPSNTTFIFVGMQIGEFKQMSYIELTHELKEDAKTTVRQLKASNYDVRIITGSTPIITHKLISELTDTRIEAPTVTDADLWTEIGGIKFKAGIPPEGENGKDGIINQLQRTRNIIFAGDGTNDIPGALAARKTIGSVAVGYSSDMSKTFDVTINKLSDLLKLIPIAKKSINTQKSIIIISLLYTTITMLLAAIVFPLMGMTMMMGCFGICMAFSSLCALLLTCPLIPALRKIIAPREQTVPELRKDEHAPYRNLPTSAELNRHTFNIKFKLTCCDREGDNFLRDNLPKIRESLHSIDITRTIFSKELDRDNKTATISFQLTYEEPDEIVEQLTQALVGERLLEVSRPLPAIVKAPIRMGSAAADRSLSEADSLSVSRATPMPGIA